MEISLQGRKLYLSGSWENCTTVANSFHEGSPVLLKNKTSRHPKLKPDIYARYLDDIFTSTQTGVDVSQLKDTYKSKCPLTLRVWQKTWRNFHF